ncbi:MAG: hypothetical protein K8R86_00035 [Bacteroidales bacterium]|nr:hypothetical protein [Bacteroidales bacterium]
MEGVIKILNGYLQWIPISCAIGIVRPAISSSPLVPENRVSRKNPDP